jgi:hypothetical protein
MFESGKRAFRDWDHRCLCLACSRLKIKGLSFALGEASQSRHLATNKLVDLLEIRAS